MIETPLDVLVETEGNKDAIACIKGITQAESPQRIFLVGPAGSGKTILLRARAAVPDLLSTKKMLYRLCAEPARAIRAGVADKFFDQLGSVKVLFLDDFDGFYEDIEASGMLMPLLMEERNREGLDTVISARKPLSEYDISAFGNAFDGFEEIRIEPLGADAMPAYIASLVESYSDPDKDIKLTDEATEHLAGDTGATLNQIRMAVRALLRERRGEDGDELGLEDVKTALEAAMQEEE